MTRYAKSGTRVQTRRPRPKRRLLRATASGQTLAAAPKISVMKSRRFITSPMLRTAALFSVPREASSVPSRCRLRVKAGSGRSFVAVRLYLNIGNSPALIARRLRANSRHVHIRLISDLAPRVATRRPMARRLIANLLFFRTATGDCALRWQEIRPINHRTYYTRGLGHACVAIDEEPLPSPAPHSGNRARGLLPTCSGTTAVTDTKARDFSSGHCAKISTRRSCCN
jgi:hypothetical protein